jgi:hypothetical protein
MKPKVRFLLRTNEIDKYMEKSIKKKEKTQMNATKT